MKKVIGLLLIISFVFVSCQFSEKENELPNNQNVDLNSSNDNIEEKIESEKPESLESTVSGYKTYHLKDKDGNPEDVRTIIGPNDKEFVVYDERNDLIELTGIYIPKYEGRDNVSIFNYCIIKENIKIFMQNKEIYIEDNGEIKEMKLGDLIPGNAQEPPVAVIMTRCFYYLSDENLTLIFSFMDHGGNTETGFIFKIDLKDYTAELVVDKTDDVISWMVNAQIYNDNIYILYTNYTQDKYKLEVRNINDLALINDYNGLLENGLVIGFNLEEGNIVLVYYDEQTLEEKSIAI